MKATVEGPDEYKTESTCCSRGEGRDGFVIFRLRTSKQQANGKGISQRGPAPGSVGVFRPSFSGFLFLVENFRGMNRRQSGALTSSAMISFPGEMVQEGATSFSTSGSELHPWPAQFRVDCLQGGPELLFGRVATEKNGTIDL